MENIKTLIENSQNILVTAHKAPDPDAFASVGFVAQILKQNFPTKKIIANIEGEISSKYLYIPELKEISSKPIIKVLENCDLVILLDANTFSRTTIGDVDTISETIDKRGIRTVIIDHHDLNGKDKCDIFINNFASSASEEAYRVFIKELGLKPYHNFADTLLFGIASDTGSFRYPNKNHRKTLEIVSDLLDLGGNMERIMAIFEKQPAVYMEIFAELAKNFVCKERYNYTYISDEFLSRIYGRVEIGVYKESIHDFMDKYLRSMEVAKWGFALYKPLTDLQGEYSGSIRAINGVINTLEFSTRLDGGGHKPASGFTIRAGSINEALEIVEKVIAENYDQAVKTA